METVKMYSTIIPRTYLQTNRTYNYSHIRLISVSIAQNGSSVTAICKNKAVICFLLSMYVHV